jgi:hypothetical protein
VLCLKLQDIAMPHTCMDNFKMSSGDHDQNQRCRFDLHATSIDIEVHVLQTVYFPLI